MKKYTNKILITVIALFIVAFTVRFFVIACDIKKEIEESENIELNINN